MNRDCKVAVLIPVFNESLDMLLRPLLSLARQTRVRSKDFKVAFVVSNNRKKALDRSTEFLQNRKAVAFLRFLNSKKRKCPFSLSLGQERGVLEIRKSGLVVSVLDKTLPQHAEVIDNVGAARDWGGAEICADFLSVHAKENGIIAMTDCDCRVSNNYIYELIKSFKPEDVNVVAGRWLTEVDPALAHGELLRQAFAIHVGGHTDFKYYAESELQMQTKSHKRHGVAKVHMSNGQNMAVRVRAWLASGGVPHISSFEDLIFGQRLSVLPGEMVYNPNFSVITLLRVSERVGMAGIGRRVRTMHSSIEDFLAGRSGQIAIPDRNKMFGLFNDVYSSVCAQKLTSKILCKHLLKYGVDLNLIDAADIQNLTVIIMEAAKGKHGKRGFAKIENLVLKKIYPHLPKQILGGVYE